MPDPKFKAAKERLISLPPQVVMGEKAPAQKGMTDSQTYHNRLQAAQQYTFQTNGTAAYEKLNPAQKQAFWQMTPEQRHQWFQDQNTLQKVNGSADPRDLGPPPHSAQATTRLLGGK